jgi:predicted TIM-barrel fold metal-dependent hydrolase
MIDIHVHMHPPRLFAAIRKWFKEKSDWHLNHPTEPADICQALRDHGVDRFAFCSYAHKPDMADNLNEWLIRTSLEIERYGLPLATVHPDDSDCVSYLAKAFEKGCIGLKIHEDVQKFGVDDKRLQPVYEVVSEFNGFVLAHIGPVPWDNTLRGAPNRVARVPEASGKDCVRQRLSEYSLRL